ncbi:OmpA family protein [Hyunsoonleella pacifica]|uniref:OmpA family protein n=2 Tax=Hyunsoonleella pacifica TaxID=1080224 RepID=A0A4Q9FT23_9FLAO|nr:OmpA family protein [Hyunsoonleella pacifica]
MKNNLLFLFFVSLCLCVKSQSYIGFLTDNYSGVHGVISNPASIVDSRYKLDINIAGVSAFLGNNYYGVHVFDALKEGYSFDVEAKTFPASNNGGMANLDVLGPSFMFNLSEKSSISIFTRGRFFANVNDVNGASLVSIDDDTTDDFNLNEGTISALTHAWSELGVTYAQVILNRKHNFLKGGFSLKYLKGLGSSYVVGSDILVNYDADGTDLGGGETTGSISSTGFVNYARFDEFDSDNYDYKAPSDASGFGIDLGFIYEWRPNYKDYKSINSGYSYRDINKYKLKIGFSITDIGNINYKKGIREGYSIANPNVSEEDYDNAADLGNFLNNFYTQTDATTGYIVDLPTAVHLNIDWNLNQKWYLNFNTDYSLMSKERRTANFISNTFSLTPRYESKWFSFYLPFSVIETNGFRVGAGFRAGPLYMGSGSVISAFSSDKNKQADVYAGLKIPFYYGKPKDKDGDGIKDNDDECPEEVGPIENKGCPYTDKDGDGILDNEDECPEEEGPRENKGCPWKDSDRDGVLDKDDKCVFEAGTIPNKGCPEEEVTQELQATLNAFARTILFDSGTAKIKEESNEVLLEIVIILKDHPSAGFTIEGHTDSTGGEDLNRELSELRANAVKDFLVKNGIDANRLLTVGYGESKPIFSNITPYGRSRNRRVEINLID